MDNSDHPPFMYEESSLHAKGFSANSVEIRQSVKHVVFEAITAALLIGHPDFFAQLFLYGWVLT